MTQQDDSIAFRTKVSSFCQRALGGSSKIDNLRRLTGGANMESWLIEYGGTAFVLRRMPTGMSELGGIGLSSEARLIKAARDGSVKAPKVCGILIESDDLGSGFLMEKIEGETLPHKIFRDTSYSAAVQNLTQDCAIELAKIHAMNVDDFSDILDTKSPQQMIDALYSDYRASQCPIPVFEAAFSWLRENMPNDRAHTILHGDFRMGNLMIDEMGISGVLDWELAHIGDPAQDVAYLCTPSWRFGNYHKTVGGFGDLDGFLDAYARRGGLSIPRSDVQFWMIYSSLWWATVCFSMTNTWRSGEDRGLERIVIGRRVSECEVDILILLEEAMSLTAPRIDWKLPTEPAHIGQPDGAELMTALIAWDSDVVIPSAESRDLFQARVARNALGILKREALYSPTFEQQQNARLAKLGLDNVSLCAKLATGDLTLANPDILSHLRHQALETLSIDQPKYVGLQAALKDWT